jgi:outer membrane protein assembly factor BamD
MPWSEPDLEPNADAEALFKHAMHFFDNKIYARSIYFFEKLRNEHPFAPQGLDAELKLSEALYRNKEYLEAIQGFKAFLAFHPTHKKKPKVIHFLGLAHFDQFNGIDREPKNIQLATGYFRTVIKDHPKSEFAADAAEKLAQCRKYLAERELYVAGFYLKDEKYLAAIDRLQVLLRKYRDTPTAVRGLYQLGETYRLQKNTLKAALAYEALLQHYGDHPLSKKARTQLAQLDKTKQDPLAMLMMRDGRPVYTPLPDGNQQATVGGQQGKRDIVLVAKKEVVQEELGVDKGVFRRVVDTINPFSSSDEPDQQEDKEETGFFTSLWPFGDNGDNKSDNNNKGEANRRLVTKIDSSLKKEGITIGSQQIETKAPIPDLPEVREEPVTNPAKVLGHVDETLGKEGKDLGGLPPAPEISSRLFADRPAKPNKDGAAGGQTASRKRTGSSTSSSTSGLLSAIDAELKKKDVKLPDLPEIPSGNLNSAEEASRRRAAKIAPKVVELSPRLAREKKSPLLKAGEFELREKPGASDQASSAENAAGTEPVGVRSSQHPGKLPEAVITGRSSSPAREKSDEKKSGEKIPGLEEEESRGALETLNENLESIGKILNPFNW